MVRGGNREQGTVSTPCLRQILGEHPRKMPGFPAYGFKNLAPDAPLIIP